MSVTAILLAAGASSRMKSTRSKLLYPLLGRTVIDWALEQASHLAEDLIVVVGHQKEDVIANSKDASKINKKIKRVDFAEQKKPLGTADAVRAAMPFLKKRKASDSIFIMG